ncbi:GNAT family N-acetyltransferase [Kineococcus rhizosphaerae]|uniref:Putative N-acetyltransferase YhbS n=1 Tax=Kineococcus rhizosphaerae TaxID=559628 RepID=A0A2T0R510_9ACTN|nr:GNAT family N-acetyltransferase [Kineococcus rhizosphaerae]PRY15850.1 putative N-acetyltransferase YhbS [Kineococcus rhizosphaerae]
MEFTGTTNAAPDRRDWARRWFDPWYDVLAAGEAVGRDDPSTWRRGELRAALERGSTEQLRHHVLALEHGEPVAVAEVELYLRDNTHVAWVNVVVHPAHRRRGVGTALLSHALDVVAAAGRTSVRVSVDRPAAVDETRWPGSVAARRRGFIRGQLAARRQLPLPVPPTRLAALESDARAHAAGYAVRSWAGPVPEEDLEALARLNARMSTDVPRDDLTVEPEVWDGARVREVEAERAAQGRRQWVAVAADGGGQLVAYTVLVVSDDEPERLIQLDTLVVAEHRGHRLGTLVKLECLRRAVADHPAAQRVSTWNAVSNAPMVAVNEAMGFVLDEFIEELEAPLAAVRRTLPDQTLRSRT